MQSKMQSLIEAWVNVIIGFGINLIANLIVLPAFGYAVTVGDALGHEVTVGDALGISLVFTAIPIARSYFIRRWFNSFLRKAFQ